MYSSECPLEIVIIDPLRQKKENKNITYKSLLKNSRTELNKTTRMLNPKTNREEPIKLARKRQPVPRPVNLKCPNVKCSLIFTKRRWLEQHLKCHGMEYAFYKCNKCPKRFFSRTDLLSHSKAHDVDDLLCEYCGKLFELNCRLVAHMRHHFDERPFTCQHPQCDKAFCTSSHLKRHETIHSRKAKIQEQDLIVVNNINQSVVFEESDTFGPEKQLNTRRDNLPILKPKLKGSFSSLPDELLDISEPFSSDSSHSFLEASFNNNSLMMDSLSGNHLSSSLPSLNLFDYDSTNSNLPFEDIYGSCNNDASDSASDILLMPEDTFSPSISNLPIRRFSFL